MSPSKVYGLIGYPVKHSLSPLMHNAAFRKFGIDAEYRLFEVKPDDLESFLLNRKDVIGFNITIPHKVKAKEILEDKFPFDKNAYMMQQDLYYVKLSGAVNTVKRINDKLEYWNTDAFGFLRSLQEDLGFETEGKNVLIIGCGGAGRAAIAALSWKNMGINKIYAYDINEEAAKSAEMHFSQFLHLAAKLEFISGAQRLSSELNCCQLLVNATPLGMKEDDPSPIDKNLLHKGLFVYDVVYNRDTELIKDAKSVGCKAAGGLGMFLHQGAAAFNLWTGKGEPIDVMRGALKAAI